MSKLVLVRHGESVWNLENRFTGWTDVDLSWKGIQEAKCAGILLHQKGYFFDIAFTSFLQRAQHTLDYILKEMNISPPVIFAYQLNERHYGALQGLNKHDTALKFGEEQVHIWRRSYDVRPPLLSSDDKNAPCNDPKYRNIDLRLLPLGESLKDTYERVIPYFKKEILPHLQRQENVIVVAHGNSLRALIKYLENISDTDIVDVEIPTGKPLCYLFNEQAELVKHFYVGEEDE